MCKKTANLVKGEGFFYIVGVIQIPKHRIESSVVKSLEVSQDFNFLFLQNLKSLFFELLCKIDEQSIKNLFRCPFDDVRLLAVTKPKYFLRTNDASSCSIKICLNDDREGQ